MRGSNGEEKARRQGGPGVGSASSSRLIDRLNALLGEQQQALAPCFTSWRGAKVRPWSWTARCLASTASMQGRRVFLFFYMSILQPLL